MRNKGTFYYKYYAIKLKTLEAYWKARDIQLNGKVDKFIDGLVVAYRLTLESLGYEGKDLSDSYFLYTEIERLKKQD